MRKYPDLKAITKHINSDIYHRLKNAAIEHPELSELLNEAAKVIYGLRTHASYLFSKEINDFDNKCREEIITENN